MQRAFKDHFSDLAAGYADCRPAYPDALAAAVAALAPGRLLAWDVGCGSGQLSGQLAGCFQRVVATDASAAQVGRAPPHPRITYAAAAAEAAPLRAGCVDLVIAAQAAHWFDLEAFCAEAGRVARAGGLVALVCYGLVRIAPAVDAVVDRLYYRTLGRYWPAERRHIDDGYARLTLPWPALPAPATAREMTAHWTRHQLTGYLETWSAVNAMARATNRFPVREEALALAAAWGEPDRVRTVRWPLTVRLARVT